MKYGKAVLVRDKVAFSFSLMKLLGDVVEVAKKTNCDFFYFIDKNMDARNFDVYEKVAEIKPFIVETNSIALIKKLNSILAPIATKHFGKVDRMCLCIGCGWRINENMLQKTKYLVVKETSEDAIELIKKARKKGIKILAFEKIQKKINGLYGVIEEL